MTKKQHDEKVFPRDQFFKNPLELKEDGVIVDREGQVLVRLLKNAVPESLLKLLETAAESCKQAVVKGAEVTNSRGKYVTLKFGSYVERGGSGAIWMSDEHPFFLAAMDKVGKYVSAIFKEICPEIFACTSSLPAELQLWAGITLMFWNATSIKRSHTDPRDWGWSLVLPFGNFTKGTVDLCYLNATVEAKRGDLYLLRSNEVYHDIVSEEVEDRQVLVFTNHKSVVQRFINTDLSDKLMKVIHVVDDL